MATIPIPNPSAAPFYSICQTINVGCTLYSDALLTTPAANNYYADEFWCYEVFGNGEVIAKTSVASCFLFETTTSTTTSSTTTPNGYFKFSAVIVPYDALDPTWACPYGFAPQEADVVDFYTNNNDPTTNMVGDYISLNEATCQNSYNGLPITNWVLLWSPDGAVEGRKVFRINNLCTVTQEWVCFP
jgi:hypothetical protein